MHQIVDILRIATRSRGLLEITEDLVGWLRPQAVETGLLSGPFSLLAWTTTPWTLPSNLALAVGPELDYAVLERDGERVVLGAERVEAYAAELEGYELLGTVRGAELVGR